MSMQMLRQDPDGVKLNMIMINDASVQNPDTRATNS